MTEFFNALQVDLVDSQATATVEKLTFADLPEGDILIEVHYSSVNYKDALAFQTKGGVVRTYPMIPGIDLSGIVKESTNPTFKVGDPVLVTGYKLGIQHFGGYSQFARVPSEWVVPLPAGLSLREAMIIGTAGFTAALSIHQLELNGLTPSGGDILVVGATGGVGSMAIAQLKALGYSSITAGTRKQTESDFLFSIGASQVSPLSEIQLDPKKPLAKQRWQGVVDPVGGDLLPDLFAQINYNGALALSGNAGGINFSASVFPFILRGVKLLGIDSVDCPFQLRQELWSKLATTMKPANLEGMLDNEISLTELPLALEKILAGKMRGRTLVKLN